MMGLLDLSRAFYYAVNIEGAAREGARHGAWFDTATRSNIYLDDSDIMAAVNSSLAGAGLTGVLKPGGCLAGADGNSINNKPYASTAYPLTTQQVYVYICYTQPTGPQFGSVAVHPTDNAWRLGDVNVAILMNFGLITPFIQNIFGNGVPLAYNEHFTIQGKP
jgi:hypothetical protein